MLAPCYLIHGGEPLQTEEIITAIKYEAVKQGYNKHEVFDITTQFNWEELLNRCQNLDLFAEHTLMELRLQSETLSKQGTLALESLLKQQDPSFCIIIRAAKLKSQTLNSNWVRHIQKDGKVHIAKPIVAAQWHGWIAKRLTSAKFIASKDVIECIAKCYEGNLLAASQCIKRLAAALPAGTILLSQVQPYIEQNAQFSIFELTNAALDGNCDRTFRIFNNLKNEGVDPVLILWGITKEIRNLVLFKIEGPQKLGIWGDNIARMERALQRLTITKLEQLLHHAKKIDTTIKGMQPGDAWDALLALYLTIAGNQILTMEDVY